MTSPLTIPICWEPSRIERAISIKAKLDEKQTDYFLACHSPIRQLLDVRAKQDGQVLDEEQLYKRMIKSNQRDVQGDPGSAEFFQGVDAGGCRGDFNHPILVAG